MKINVQVPKTSVFHGTTDELFDTYSLNVALQRAFRAGCLDGRSKIEELQAGMQRLTGW